MSHSHPEQALAQFAAELRLENVPVDVQDRAEDLFLDWVGSALAGKGARPVESIARFAAAMGPAGGRGEILLNPTRTTPLFAAPVKAPASPFLEQDDLHNRSVVPPAATRF